MELGCWRTPQLFWIITTESFLYYYLLTVRLENKPETVRGLVDVASLGSSWFAKTNKKQTSGWCIIHKVKKKKHTLDRVGAKKHFFLLTASFAQCANSYTAELLGVNEGYTLGAWSLSLLLRLQDGGLGDGRARAEGIKSKTGVFPDSPLSKNTDTPLF